MPLSSGIFLSEEKESYPRRIRLFKSNTPIFSRHQMDRMPNTSISSFLMGLSFLMALANGT